MRLNINPTRMELLKLKKRIVLARRGHKLLKDKQDELMRKFTELMEESRGLRREVEAALAEAQANFVDARSIMSKEHVDHACRYSGMRTELRVDYAPLMNLRLPQYDFSVSGEYFSYSVVTMPAAFDLALKKYKEVLPKMIKMAQQEKALQIIAAEIESTRRRVNALEHILIPNLFETIRYISMKLEEIERGNITRLMKVKEMIQSK